MATSGSTYLRSRQFDSFFIGFIPILAVCTAYVAYFNPEYFDTILLLDLALLGYHHVIATYTRLAFDKASLIENRTLVFYLPPIVLLSVFGLALIGQAWLLATVYLHWQWYHYTRQSEGISKAIRFRSKSNEAGADGFNRFLFYFVPTAAFLAMSARQPDTFLFMQVFTLPIPMLIADLLLGASLAGLMVWLFLQVRGVRSGRMRPGHLAYLISHYAIYYVSYVFIEDVTIGWLAINIWHNLQYIAFVWHSNRNRYKEGFDRARPVISWLSQPNRAFQYVGFCLIATYAFYSLVDYSITLLSPYTALPLVVIMYQAINFHHYIVDSKIWKLRKPEVRRAVGITG